jgi:hypothetical protein
MLTPKRQNNIHSDESSKPVGLEEDVRLWDQAMDREMGKDPERFDRAWEERAELIAQVGTRPEDPQVSLARLVQDRDAANERLVRFQRSAVMLPEGHRGVLGQLVADADVQYTRAAARAAEVTAAICDGSHPQAVARAEWDAANGLVAERITALTRQCTASATKLSLEDWTVPAPPTAEVDQAIWLAMTSDYASMRARVERTGRTTQADVDALNAHREWRQNAVLSSGGPATARSSCRRARSCRVSASELGGAGDRRNSTAASPLRWEVTPSR